MSTTAASQYITLYIHTECGNTRAIPFSTKAHWTALADLEAELGRDTCRALIAEVESGKHAEEVRQVQCQTRLLVRDQERRYPTKRGFEVFNAQSFDSVIV